MISGPKIPKKTITDYPISFVDVAPTILDLAGIEMKITDGASFKERLYNPQNGGDYEKIILIEYWGEGKPTTIDRGCSWWGNPELSVLKSKVFRLTALIYCFILGMYDRFLVQMSRF